MRALKLGNKTGSLLFLSAGIVGASVCVAEPVDTLFELSLDELVNTRVTIATRHAQKNSEAASIVTVLNGTRIRDSGATTLFQLLSTVPGFTPIQQISSERLMVVRGFGLKDGVLVQIDGVTVNDAFAGNFDFYERPINDIERIEIIRGPGSALYGGYALSAIIQIFTFSAQPGDDKVSATLATGNNERHSVALSTQKEVTAFDNQFLVSASFAFNEEAGDSKTIKQDAIFTPEPGTFLPPLTNPSLTPANRRESFEKYAGGLKIEWHDLQLNYSLTQLISEPMLSHTGLVVEEDTNLKDVILDQLTLQYETQFRNDVKFDAKVYAVRNRYKLLGQSQPPSFLGDENQDGLNEEWPTGVIENFEHTTFSMGAQYGAQYNLNKEHKLSAGIVYDYTELTDVKKEANISLAGRGPRSLFPVQDMTHEYMQDELTRITKAFYVQDLWSFTSRTSLTLGVRFDEYSDFGSTTNPRVGLVHKFSDNWYGKMLYGEAFKPPAFVQLFDLTPTQSQFRVQGNRDLEPTEISTTELELGYEISASALVSVNVFQNRTDSEVFFNNTPGIEQWQNGNDRRSKGIELEFRGRAPGLDHIYSNYSYQRTEGVESGPQADIHSPHRINVGGLTRFSDDIGGSFNLSYYSSPDRERADSRNKVDAKTLVSISLEWKNIFEALNAKLSVQNLFDEQGSDETHAALGVIDDIPISSRAFWLSMEYVMDKD